MEFTTNTERQMTTITAMTVKMGKDDFRTVESVTDWFGLDSHRWITFTAESTPKGKMTSISRPNTSKVRVCR